MTDAPLAPALEQTPPGAAELARLCTVWRRGGDPDGPYLFPAKRAAEMLGLPKKTYDFIEQGRGFRYPVMLVLALQAFR